MNVAILFKMAILKMQLLVSIETQNGIYTTENERKLHSFTGSSLTVQDFKLNTLNEYLHYI